MRRIVITGATGFIGIHLINEWLKEDCEIYAVIRPKSPHAHRVPASDHVHLVELSMSEYDRLPAIVDKADCFYHLAWEGVRAPLRDDKELQEKNCDCALSAFRAATKIGCSFFLGSGSQAEYGATYGIVDEDYPCNPNTEYGRQKLHTYESIREMSESMGINFIWTRIFSIYGPYDYPRSLVMSCIEKMRKNEHVDMTEGRQLWDYLYVEDAAKAMKLFSERACEDGVYILASGQYRQLRDYVTEIKQVMGSESELEFGAIPYGAEGPVNLTPSAQKIMKTLRWNPETAFSEGIRKIITWNL